MAVFSWKPSPHHLDLVVLPADIVLCMICLNFALATGGPATLSLPLLPEDRLRGLESLRPSSQSFCFRTE